MRPVTQPPSGDRSPQPGRSGTRESRGYRGKSRARCPAGAGVQRGRRGAEHLWEPLAPVCTDLSSLFISLPTGGNRRALTSNPARLRMAVAVWGERGLLGARLAIAVEVWSCRPLQPSLLSSLVSQPPWEPRSPEGGSSQSRVSAVGAAWGVPSLLSCLRNNFPREGPCRAIPAAVVSPGHAKPDVIKVFGISFAGGALKGESASRGHFWVGEL